jgi:hypothetical protein
VTAQGLHVLDETAQLGELLGELGLGDEGALAALDLDQAAAGKVLDGQPNGGAAHREALDQRLFRRQLRARLEAAVGDAGRQGKLDLRIERNMAGGVELHARHHDVMTS